MKTYCLVIDDDNQKEYFETNIQKVLQKDHIELVPIYIETKDRPYMKSDHSGFDKLLIEQACLKAIKEHNCSIVVSDYQIVTEKTKVDESFKKTYKERIHFLIYGTKKYPFTYIFKFLANCFISLFYFFRYQPEVIVTTGTHTAVPMCYIARIFGSKVIYIETFANRTTATVAGRIIYPIANTFVVQWEEMKEIYPKAVCWGWLY